MRKIDLDIDVNIVLRAYLNQYGLGRKSRVLLSKTLELSGAKGLEGLLNVVSNKDFEKAKREVELATTAGIKILNLFHPAYPCWLREIEDPPVQLFIKGDVEKFKSFENKYVSIVGSRLASSYGLAQAYYFSKEFTKHGLLVVSGFAKGVDSQAHLGAMKVGTIDSSHPGVAVFGAGVNYIYPKENQYMYEQFLALGGIVVSEYGINTKPDKKYFPERNRIVSGLSKATCIIEAKSRSGARITARLAGEQGREVFALPGRISDRGSTGTLELINDGARILRGVEEVVELYGKVEKSKGKNTLCPILKLIAERKRVHFDELIEYSGVTPQELGAKLSQYELQGDIYSQAGDFYSLFPVSY